MFNITPKNTVHIPTPKSDFIRYTPPSLNFVNGEKNQIFLYTLERECYFLAGQLSSISF